MCLTFAAKYCYKKVWFSNDLPASHLLISLLMVKLLFVNWLCFISIPVWSRHHPQIPQRYVPPWTKDMKNRNLILEVISLSVMHGCFCWVFKTNTLSISYFFLQNCKLSNYPCGPHDTSIYLVHRGEFEADPLIFSDAIFGWQGQREKMWLKL